MDTPRLHPMSAMVESSGSPLVRRVGRILSGGGVARARTSRLAIAWSAGALVTLAGVAPRISVANAAMTERRFTFLRAVLDPNDPMAHSDTMIVFRSLEVVERAGARVVRVDTTRR
jgi:hypothetical protein